MYLLSTVAEDIGDRMNATTFQGNVLIPCARKQGQNSFEFGFGGSEDPKISIPCSAMIYPYGFPAVFGSLAADDGTPLCYHAVIPTNGKVLFSTQLLFDPPIWCLMLITCRFLWRVPNDKSNCLDSPSRQHEGLRAVRNSLSSTSHRSVRLGDSRAM